MRVLDERIKRQETLRGLARDIFDLSETKGLQLDISGIQAQLENTDLGFNVRKNLEAALANLQLELNTKESFKNLRTDLLSQLNDITSENLTSFLSKPIEELVEIDPFKGGITQTRKLTDLEIGKERDRLQTGINKKIDEYVNSLGKAAAEQSRIKEIVGEFVDNEEYAKKLSEDITTIYNGRREIVEAELRAERERVKILIQEKKLREKGEGGQFQIGLDKFRRESQQGMESFFETLGYDAPAAFRDNMITAITESINGAKSLKEALRDAAISFLEIMQQKALGLLADSLFTAFLPNFTAGTSALGFKKASGGMVTGGSGVKDDVPHLLMGGEYVIRKAAVKKYGEDFLTGLNKGVYPKMASGGFFVPGFRGQGEIRGMEDMQRFAEQRITSGATDVIYGRGGSAGINLEPQSRRLTASGLRRGSPMQELLASTQQEALRLVEAKLEQEKLDKEKDKQFWRSLIGTIATTFIGAGVSSLVGGATQSAVTSQQVSNSGLTLQDASVFDNMRNYSFIPKGATGGKMGRGGAMLMGGEYIVPREAVSRYGKSFWDDINNMSMPKFAMGGQVGAASNQAMVTNGGDVNIEINVMSDGSSQTSTQGDANSSDMNVAERIRTEVVRIIEEEKRVGGALSSRNRR